MAFFPFFVELQGQDGLIVGGGQTALGKARHLVAYGPRLTVIAPQVLPELEALDGVRTEHRAFARADLRHPFAFVIAATDDVAVNHTIAQLCREQRIPVNVVDDPDACSFLFPALVRDGPLSIGISTGGASPTVAVRLKEEISAMLPRQLGDILYALAVRETVKRQVPCPSRRRAILKALSAESLALGRPLTAQEAGRIMEQRKEGT